MRIWDKPLPDTLATMEERVEGSMRQMADYIVEMSEAGVSTAGILPEDPDTAARVRGYVHQMLAERHLNS